MPWWIKQYPGCNGQLWSHSLWYQYSVPPGSSRIPAVDLQIKSCSLLQKPWSYSQVLGDSVATFVLTYAWFSTEHSFTTIAFSLWLNGLGVHSLNSLWTLSCSEFHVKLSYKSPDKWDGAMFLSAVYISSKTQRGQLRAGGYVFLNGRRCKMQQFILILEMCFPVE